MNPYREPGKPLTRLKQFFVDRTRVLWPTVVILAALSAIAATASLRVNGIKFADGSNTYSAVYNVKMPEFGAIGDGVADDTTAIQNAVNACTTGTVFLPSGTYKISSSITIAAKSGIRFVGAGPRSTRIVYSGAAGVMLDIQGVRESYFADFGLVGASATSDTTGIKYNGVNPNTSQHNTFDRIWFENYFTYGIRIGQVAYQCSETDYRSLVFNHCSVAGVSIEDANAVNHNFYNCNWANHAIGITSNNAGTGGGFNLFGCGFVTGTVVDIQNYPSSRGTVISGVWSEGGAAFLQMPQASTGSTVTLDDCSVNGSTSVGPHVRVGAGSLNVVGGKYTATPNTFTFSVGNLNGNVASINTIGTQFNDGNPFTGANIALASIRRIGVKYAAVGGEVGDLIGPGTSATDVIGNDLVFTSGAAGTVSAAAGKAAGAAKLVGATGVAGNGSFAAGPGGHAWLVAGPAGTNGGAGGNTGGNVFIQPGALSGAGNNGTINFLDVAAATQAILNPGGSTFFYPQTTNAKALGGTSNYWSNVFAARQTELGQAIAAASSITINPASGDSVRINLSATAITSITYTAGNDGEISTVCVAEDATGTRTIPTTWTNVRFAGGSYTATTTLNKIDCLTFRYNGTAAAWLEVGRAMNL